jgi:hypothetical protein
MRRRKTPVIRRLLLVVAVLSALYGGFQPAGAGDIYPTSCGFVLDPPLIPIGGEVHILGSNFTPGSEVDFFIDGEFLGTAEVDPDDADGNIDVTFPLPEGFNIDGEFTITTVCPDGDVASNILIVGLGVTTTTTTGLPVTGSDSTVDFVRIGIGLVVVGALVLALSRRRATQHASTPAA